MRFLDINRKSEVSQTWKTERVRTAASERDVTRLTAAEGCLAWITKRSKEMKAKLKKFIQENGVVLNQLSSTFKESDMATKYLTITMDKEGYIKIEPDYSFESYAIRMSLGEPYKIHATEIVEL
jgi:hypothetical protein